MSAPTKRSGHIGLKYRHYLLIWGGHNSERFMDRMQLWFYNLITKKWEMKESTGEVPPCTSGSCSALIDDFLYFFGGFSYLGCLHDVYMLDIRALRWQKLDIRSSEPSPRDKFGCWIRESKIIFFGGYGIKPLKTNIQSGIFVYDESSTTARGGWNNDLLSFDTTNHVWKALPLSNATPSPRAAHACTSISEDIGFLFGGRHQHERLDDLYSILLDSFVWTKIEPCGLGPQGRTWHSLIPTDENHLFVFGGLNTQNETLADAWMYNITENSWTEVEYKHRKTRRWHSTSRGFYPGQIVIFGGCCPVETMNLDGFHLNKLDIFQLTPLPLRKIALDAVAKFGESCGPLTELPLELQEDITKALSGG